MKALHSIIKNWMGISGELEIDIIDHTHLIGENEAGKSSIINSFIDSFEKINVAELKQAINKDAKVASYEHKFTENGKDVILTIKRTYRADTGKNKLTIDPDPPENPYTRKPYTNKEFLTVLWPHSTKLDVAEIKQRKAVDWTKDILQIMGGDVAQQYATIQAADKKARTDRTAAFGVKEKAVKSVPDKAPEKVVRVDTTKILEKLNIARQAKAKFDHASSRISQISNEISGKEALIAQLQREISRLQTEQKEQMQKLEEFTSSVSAVVSLEEQLVDAESINEQAAEYEWYEQAVKNAKDATAAWQKLDDFIKKDIPAQRTALFQNNPCPIPNISMDEEGALLYKGVPIEQINDGSYVELGTAITLAKIPDTEITLTDGSKITPLHTIFIENGSLADTNTRARIRQMCDDAGCQYIMELVAGEVWSEEKQQLVIDYNTASKVGIAIKEGKIYKGESNAKED